MCLHNVHFTLSYDKGCRDFIGYGYKKLKEEDVKTYKRKWVEASGNKENRSEKISSAYTTPSDDGNSYIPGFHIFLNKEDAEKYTANTYYKLIKVKFRGVLGFGTNEIQSYVNNHLQYKPCIISRYMKFVEYCDGNTAKAA